MALSYKFLIERADHSAHEAAGAELDNVRARALRSEAAWRAMASELSEVLRNRETALQSKIDPDRGHEPQP